MYSALSTSKYRPGMMENSDSMRDADFTADELYVGLVEMSGNEAPTLDEFEEGNRFGVNTMKHQFDGNLDDEQECAEFIETHATLKGRALANRLGFKGKGSVEAANSLSGYAWNKHTAISCRTKGDIPNAMKYEEICDWIYKERIQPLIECW